MNRSTSPATAQDRKTDLFLKFAYHDIDTIEYILPEGFYPESSAEGLELKSDFGIYSTKFLFDENKVFYIRNIVMFKGRYPASSFKEYNNFIKEISKADRVKIVLANKT
ncbi:hypothetical protein BH23BAC1_BH23BAC1_11610 [soil metagenome]